MSLRQQIERDEKETGRTEAFSDGVFAIAITLLVLELKVPGREAVRAAGGLGGALLGEWAMYLAFLTSFATILVMWANHHTLFTHIRRVSAQFLYLNGLLLFFVTLLPFPTAILAGYFGSPDGPLAVQIYSGVCVGICVAFNLLWHCASGGGRLLDRHADMDQVRSITHRYYFGPPLYGVAFGLAFIHEAWSLGLCILLAMFFAFTGGVRRKHLPGGRHSH